MYKHTSPNGKIYIGITKHEPEKRWKANGNGYRCQPVFWRAIKKYGWDNFEHEILEENLTLEEALHLESEYIKLFDSNNPKHGYNRNSGGFGNIGRVYTDEDRKKLSEAHKNPSEETRQKISIAVKGRKVSDETREKMSNSRLGHSTSSGTKEKISQANTGKVRTDEVKKKISDSLKQFYANGGEPANKGKPLSQEAKEKLRNKMVGRKRPTEIVEKMKLTGKKVICLETGEIFPTIKIAASEKGANASAISNIICGQEHRKTSGGYHWAMYDDQTLSRLVDG